MLNDADDMNFKLSLNSLRSLITQQSNTMASLVFKFLTIMAHESKAILGEVSRLHIDHFIARAIELDTSNANNGVNTVRSSAFALVMGLISSYKPKQHGKTITSPLPLPVCIVESLREVALSHDDPYCRIALDALAQISVRNPLLSAKCQAITIVIQAIIDPFFKAMQEALMVSILYLMNDPNHRAYLNNIEYILSPLSVSFSPHSMDSLQLSIRALTIMLKSWPGLIWGFKHGGMKALVSTLLKNNPEVTSIAIDALFELFRIPHPGTSNPFQRQEVILMDTDQLDQMLTSQNSDVQMKPIRHNLTHNYVSILLMCLVDAGLIEALIELGNFTEDRTKVTVLLAELLYLSNTLLPKESCARIQQAPSLVKKAVSFSLEARLRSRASTMITNLHKYTNLKATEDLQDISLSIVQQRKVKDRRLARVDEVKKKMDWEIDEGTLMSKLRQTQVVSFEVAEWNKWKFEYITELLDGPLRNPVLLAVALKTKFFKRLLSFCSPSKKFFSELPWNYDNLIYVRTACLTMEVLSESDVGKTLLLEHPLFKEISELLQKEVQKINSKDTKDFFWSHERMLKTMSREYFTMLGILTKSENGLHILEKKSMFIWLKTMCEESNRDDLINLILTTLDYELMSECHNILHVVLSSKSTVVRYLAIRHLRHLLRSGVSDFATWGVDLLKERVTLPDPDHKVRNLALQILDEAADDENAMGRLISSQAILSNSILGAAGRALQIRFLSLKAGFDFLKEKNFIQIEMDKWIETENFNYVEQLERKLATVLNRSLNRRVSSQDTAFTHSFSTENEISIPPHFFGELCKTVEGCKLLKKSNAVNRFIKAVKSPKYSPLERRAAIWAVGHIASSETGYHFLESQNIVQLFINLISSDTDLGTKGTCFYVLGMMAGLPQVRSELEDHRWTCPGDKDTRIALPRNVHESPLFALTSYPSTFYRAKEAWEYETFVTRITSSENVELYTEILSLVSNVSNHVALEQALRGLKRLKAKSAHAFNDPMLLYGVWKLLENYSFRLKQRRTIAEMFEGCVFTDNCFDKIDQIYGV